MKETGDPINRDPIAIIGIGCRFPQGGNSPQEFWDILIAGKDCVTEVPPERWNGMAYYHPNPKTPGKTNSRWGGFVDDIDRFDAKFFGMIPREVAHMDPQQRILLESVWQALEDGGLVPARLKGTATGVFIGISGMEYGSILDGLANVNAYTATGNGMSIAANRISHIFDLKGPSFAVDTACSSSLVAVHLACQSIWTGESSLALAGGVNAMLNPERTVALGKGGMLSPDGRCKSFDASANGFVRGEGVGIVVLKPLAKALEDKDFIYGAILSTVINQDGRTPGIAVPDPKSQEAMFREACRKAGIEGRQIQFLEAHGTGTAVGDPIEANVQGAVLSEGRPAGEPCYMGSVKSNIGHLEPASGVASLIKAALALKRKIIPPNIHFNRPNPEIKFEEYKLIVPREPTPWPKRNDPALAAVNSFGFGGANASIILREAPNAADTSAENDKSHSSPHYLLPLSTRNPTALTDLAQRYLRFLSEENKNPSQNLLDVCFSASVRREHHDQRLALLGQSKEELQDQLQTFIKGAKRPGLFSGQKTRQGPPRLVFVFSGQGPQWWAMARQLLETEPLFGETVRQCDRLFNEHADWSLWDELTAEENRSRIQETHITQPAIFSLQVALAALWKSWGIHPKAVVGHSVGEVAAAHVAGMYSLEEAVRIIFHRGRVQRPMHGQGKMAVVGVPGEEAEKSLRQCGGKVSIAAINSPKSVTLSGDPAALESVVQGFQNQDVFCRYLKVEYAFHSFQMESAKEELLKSLKGLRSKSPSIPFYSTVSGKQENGLGLKETYWGDNVREPVRFNNAINQLILDGYETFLELSPHPVLEININECFSHQNKQGTVLASLRNNKPDGFVLKNSLAALYCQGHSVDWDALYPEKRTPVPLPYYPWQRERFWFADDEMERELFERSRHPLLGRRAPNAAHTWQSRLDKRGLDYLGDHRVNGAVVFPGAGYLELALAMAKEVYEGKPFVVESLEFQKAIFLNKTQGIQIQTQFNASDASFTIHSLEDAVNQSWAAHAFGSVYQDEPPAPGLIDLKSIKNRCGEAVDTAGLYEALSEAGLGYGPSFRGLERTWRGDGEALGLLKNPETLDLDIQDYQVHPAILDAGFQVSALLIPPAAKGRLFLPTRVARVKVYGKPRFPVWAHVKRVSAGTQEAEFDVRLIDDSGQLIVECQRFLCRAVDQQRPGALKRSESWFYEWRWEPSRLNDKNPSARSADFLPSNRELAQSLSQEAFSWSRKLGRQKFYDSLDPRMERLCASYIVRAFERLGLELEAGTRFSQSDLEKKWRLGSRELGIFSECLTILERFQIIKNSGDGWEVLSLNNLGPIPEWKSLIKEFPGYLAELNLLSKFGGQLHEILRGQTGAIKEPLPEEDPLLEHLYQDSPSARIYNRLFQKALDWALARLPQGRKLRVLEIGGGTGGVTSHALRRLSPEKAEYVFTDLNQSFVDKAKPKFREYSFISCQTLNLAISPQEQGLEPGSFDVVLAGNALGGMDDLESALANIQDLLAPSGTLVCLEATGKNRWLPLASTVLGNPNGAHDTNFASRSFADWERILSQAGFAEVTGTGEAVDLEGSQQTLLLATRNPEVRVEKDDPALPERAIKGRWVVFADAKGLGEKLAEKLESIGGRCFLAKSGDAFQALGEREFQINPSSRDDMAKLISSIHSDAAPISGVVHLWNLDAPKAERLSLRDLEEQENLGCLSVMNLVKELAVLSGSSNPSFYLATQGAHPIDQREALDSLAQSPASGLAQVIMREHPELNCKLVDLDPSNSAEALAALIDEIQIKDEEEEIAYRDGGRYVKRLVRTDIEAGKAQASLQELEAPSYSLDIGSFGSLSNFKFRESDRRQPGPGEVEIRVMAAGLNFRDVMIAMGMLPGELEGKEEVWQCLGLECSGVVTARGEGIHNFQVGDEVIALTDGGCFGAYAIVPELTLMPKPAHLSFEECATIPVTFLTAYYMLHHAGRLREKEKILIHAGAGGVGLAAIQIALASGAEVFATAGNEDKRNFLRGWGVPWVFDSRSLHFADEILEITGGEGVDVVLNSLAGPFIAKSISILKPFGRFLEIGKRDIYENNKVGLKPFLKGLSFITMMDIKRGFQDRGDEFIRLFKELMEKMDQGIFRPLPYRAFPISNLAGAFRTMAQARHMGKVVISTEETDLPIIPKPQPAITFSKDGAYLITGGFGGFGLAIADWLVENGARHLVLIGRSGAATHEARDAIRALQEKGVQVLEARADVTDLDAVSGVFSEMDQSMPPLKGVFHSAVTLDDGLLLQMTAEQFKRVTAPKIKGAWNLHQLTSNRKLDHFVLFSSVANVFGNPGQANYAAANAFIEALAHFRKARGLAAHVANWAPLSEVGVAARQQLNAKLEEQGFGSLSPEQAVDTLGRLMQAGPVQTVAAPFNWSRIFSRFPGSKIPPRFRHIQSKEIPDASLAGSEKSSGAPFKARLLAAEPEDRLILLADQLRKIIADVLEHSVEDLDPSQPLTELGLDSLMVQELLLAIENELEVSVPVIRLLAGPTVEEMVHWLLEEMTSGESDI